MRQLIDVNNSRQKREKPVCGGLGHRRGGGQVFCLSVIRNRKMPYSWATKHENLKGWKSGKCIFQSGCLNFLCPFVVR